MASSGYEVDADFFNLIHRLAVAGKEKQMQERRTERRNAFPTTQRIAISDGPGLPDEAEFVEVRCRDLTRNGFSFLLEGRPAFQRLIVALGAPPQVIYVACEVTHVEPVSVDAAGRVRQYRPPAGAPVSTPMMLVGCRFLERLVPDPSPQVSAAEG